jgi:acyl-[acyl-carrier-protein]-phospholipid O-acyltransferase/long-chain-fatty-acid--[acyl-carrier-protein] ligase
MTAPHFTNQLGFFLVATSWPWWGYPLALVGGLLALGLVLVVSFLIAPRWSSRWLAWLLSRLLYRIRVHGLENIPREGGALLVSNHVTWVDGILLISTIPRHVRMIIYADYARGKLLGWLMTQMGVIPIKTSEGPKSIVRALQSAREAIDGGELVCIFAEGQLTRLGQLLPFQRGLMKIIDGSDHPVIPIYLDGLWGSIFSFFQGKYFWKRPQKWPYPIGISFGQPLRKPETVHEVQQAVAALGVQSLELRKNVDLTLPRRFLRACRKARGRVKLADSSNQEVTGMQLLLRTLIFRRLLATRLLGPDERFVGVLLPPSVGGAIVNAALALLGRVAVNLNYTASREMLNSCLEQASIRRVLTSRLFVTKLKLELPVEMVYLEDLRPRITLIDKVVAGIQSYATPSFVLDRLFGLTKMQADDLLTVIFTSGSTGEPKGVMLTQHNIGSNVDAVGQLIQIKRTDTVLGILPFFHSFGYMATMWMPLVLEARAVYHYNPLDAKIVGDLCKKYLGTILMATPTFLRTYIKRCDKDQLESLDIVVVGAEKMPLDLAAAFEEKFGVRPIEGYGATETSPVAAVNIPDHRSPVVTQVGTKEGTVGRPIPGTIVRVLDQDTGAVLGLDQPGLLQIKGPHIMKGYLHKSDLTAKVLQDGWYSTGDVAKIDAEGFVTITDRASRFSKIGGEMVPHIRVEEVLRSLLIHTPGDEQELKLVVTAVPDERKGERLVVVHKPLAQPIDELYQQLTKAELPNLWLPGRDSFLEVAEIPILGTGKVDLRGVKQLALEKFNSGS